MQNVREYSNDELVALVPLPADDANKYSRGTLAAIVGSERYPGAACLAAYAGHARIIKPNGGRVDIGL